MISFWKTCHTFRKFFEDYYQPVLLISAMVVAFIGYIHFEQKHNSEELNFWNNPLRFFNENEALTILPLLVLITSLMWFFVVAINLESMRSYNELTHLQIKKQYADYLFIQLVTRIDQIESKQLCTKDIISIENFIRAHQDMRKVIDKFRMDAKKLLTLSEDEVLVPPEVFFADQEIRSSRFAHLSPEENLVRELAAS